MIQVEIENIKYNVPTSWRDVTHRKYCELISKEKVNGIELLSLLSDIQCNTLEKISEENLIILIDLCTFVNDTTLLEKSNVLFDDLSSFDVGNETWAKLEKAKQEIEKHPVFFCASSSLAKIYFGNDVSNSCILDVYGKCNYLLNNLNNFFERFKRLSESEPQDDEILADVDRFKKFGFFASCVELSRKMCITYNEVLSMTANEIYNTFLYDFEKADYEKRLYEIKSKR